MPRGVEICPACGSPQRVAKKWTPARIAIGCLIAAGVLLVAFFVIGIIAAIAIPKFANTKEKAYLAAMRSDLRNLSSAQELYFVDHRTYTPRIDALSGFVLTTGVELDGPIQADSSGWTATVRHRESPARCTIGVGAKVPEGLPEGQPVCATVDRIEGGAATGTDRDRE